MQKQHSNIIRLANIRYWCGYAAIGLLGLLAVVMLCPSVPKQSSATTGEDLASNASSSIIKAPSSTPQSTGGAGGGSVEERLSSTEVDTGTSTVDTGAKEAEQGSAESSSAGMSGSDDTNETDYSAIIKEDADNAKNTKDTENANSTSSMQSARARVANALAAQANEQSLLSVSLDGEIKFDLTPDPEGNFKTASSTLHVNTNNSTGYKVYLSADHDGELIHSNTAIADTIKPVVGTMNSTNYKEHLNSWGYSLLSSSTQADYIALPGLTSDKEIVNTEVASNDTYELGFAIAVDRTLPAGVYRGTITVTAFTNPAKLASLMTISTMQEMTPEVCQNDEVNPKPLNTAKDYVFLNDKNNPASEADLAAVKNGTKVPAAKLTDTRDNTTYTIARLADGKCWMVQNLELTLGVKDEANGIDTTKLTAKDSDLGEVKQLGNTTYSGNYEWTPVATQTKVTSNTDPNGVQSWHPNTYWYYQWNAAVAGTGGVPNTSTNYVGVNQNAQGSICPKGWRLPVSSEYGTLVSTYSITTGDKLVVAPLYFNLGGDVNSSRPISGEPASVGRGGRYWSTTAGSDTTAYYLDFYAAYDNTTLAPSFNYDRYIGELLRCLAR